MKRTPFENAGHRALGPSEVKSAKKAEPKVQICWHCLNPVTNHIRGCVMGTKEKR